MRIEPGTIKRIHINRHVIAKNRKTGSNDPPITVRTSNGNHRGHRVTIVGLSEVIYRPEKPLPCGAHLWIETHGGVKLDVVD